MKSNISLSTDLRQTQTMAPALVHSLMLLEKPILELSAIVKEEIASNPVIEQEEISQVSIDAERKQYEDIDAFDKRTEQENEFPEQPYSYVSDEELSGNPDFNGDISQEEYEDASDFSVLSQFNHEEEDYIYQAGGNNEYTTDIEEKRQFMYDSISRGESLQ